MELIPKYGKVISGRLVTAIDDLRNDLHHANPIHVVLGEYGEAKLEHFVKLDQDTYLCTIEGLLIDVIIHLEEEYATFKATEVHLLNDAFLISDVVTGILFGTAQDSEGQNVPLNNGTLQGFMQRNKLLVCRFVDEKERDYGTFSILPKSKEGDTYICGIRDNPNLTCEVYVRANNVVSFIARNGNK